MGGNSGIGLVVVKGFVVEGVWVVIIGCDVEMLEVVC